MTATAQALSAAAKTVALKSVAGTALTKVATLTATVIVATPIPTATPLAVSIVSLPPLSSGPGAIPILALFIAVLSAGFTYLPWHRRRRNLEQKLTVFRTNLDWSVKSAETCIENLRTTVRLRNPRVNFITREGLYDAYEISSEDLSELAALGEFQLDGSKLSLIYLKIRLANWYALMMAQSSNGAFIKAFDGWPEYEEWRDGMNELQDLRFTIQILDLALERLRAPFYRYWLGWFKKATIAERPVLAPDQLSDSQEPE